MDLAYDHVLCLLDSLLCKKLLLTVTMDLNRMNWPHFKHTQHGSLNSLILESPTTSVSQSGLAYGLLVTYVVFCLRAI